MMSDFNRIQEKSWRRFDRQYSRMAGKAPGPFGRFLIFMRQPWAMLVRIPLGVMFVAGGIFSFLPVLGIWMLPLGLMLLAIDIVFLRAPMAGLIVRLRGWLANRRRRRSRHAAGKPPGT